ncbi:MAG: hypothetical protein JRI23_25285, partial [Deltaproteobacteria bacterium]|nr:hypothetical protein [Deltaproteobacteria bacterium]MBW2535331.1 hypothetical protein [Deltaproteobacteria bacterium]
ATATATASARAAARPQAAPLSAERFVSLVTELSEPDADFFSDNFISNETSYLQSAADLSRAARRGGAYIGVGPEQNFTYIGLIQPDRAYVVDIRRDNLVLHLLYKAAFDLARSRSEFLTLLVTRPYDPEGAPGPGDTIEQVIAHAEKLPADPDAYEKIHQRLLDRIEKHYGLELSRKDARSLATAHKAFAKDGLDIRFKLKEKSFRRYPPLRDLLAAKDPTHERQLGFLASEESFRFVQKMQREHRLIPLVGNFGGKHALKKLGEHLHADKLTVSAFYVSNVEQYLLQDGLWWKWIRNIEGLPTDDKSLFIRCYLNQGRAHPRELAGHRTTTVLQRIGDFLATNEKKPYRSMYKLSVDEWRPAAAAPTLQASAPAPDTTTAAP